MAFTKSSDEYDSISNNLGGMVFIGYIGGGANSTVSDTGDVVGYIADDDIWVVELDGSGNIIHQKCLGGLKMDRGSSLVRKKDGGYFIAGLTSGNQIFGDSLNYHTGSGPKADGLIAELDSNLNYLGSQCYGGTDNDYFSNITVDQNGSIWVLGSTKSNDGDVSNNHGGQDVWLVQLVPDTILGIQTAATKTNYKISVYPNPAHNALTFNCSSSIPEGSAITLYDLLGNDLLKQKLVTAATTINTMQLSNGVYLFKIASNDEVLKRGKVVVEH